MKNKGLHAEDILVELDLLAKIYDNPVKYVVRDAAIEIRQLRGEIAAWKDAADNWDCSTPEELKERIFGLPDIY